MIPFFTNRPDTVIIEKIKQVIDKKNYIFTSGKNAINLIGVRAAKPVLNQFNCSLVVIYYPSETPEVRTYEFSSLPGDYYLTSKLLNSRGCAILAEQQVFEGYQFGLHQGKYPALVQSKFVKVFRDKNKDSQFDLVNQETGMFGINIHRAGKDGSTSKVSKWSAGCQIFKNSKDFDEFMNLCKNTGKSRFTYTLLNEQDLSA